MVSAAGVSLLYVCLVASYIYCTDCVTTYPTERLRTVMFKVMPIFVLVVQAYANGMHRNASDFQRRYARFISFGLFASLFGDAFLVFRHKLFIAGAGAFAIGHVFYIAGFGFRSKRMSTLGLSLCLGLIPCAVVIPAIAQLHMRLVVSAYSVVIFVMAWRSMDHALRFRSLSACAACLGALVFVVSDVMIVYTKWIQDFPYAPLCIMSTYFSAQLLIYLSTCDRYMKRLE